jgi:phosphoserine/homoserine phosphotransferase
VFAAGDSFNDLAMIEEAADGCLFRAPPSIVETHPYIPNVDGYDGLMERIDMFLSKRESA